MFDNSAKNPAIPSFLYVVTAVECLIVFTAAVLLFFFPAVAENLWAWMIPPYNSRFVGAIYFAALIPLIIFWTTRRWVPGRLVLWLIFLFTTSVMLAMFIHWDSFIWSRISTFLGFWPIYIFLPVNSALQIYWSRQVMIPAAAQMPTGWRFILFGMALLLGVYGLGLLVAPDSMTSFWLWPVDTFHARMYASAFLTPSLGCWWLAYYGETPSEDLVMGLNLFSGGFFTIAGTLITSLTVAPERKVNILAPGAWIFILMFVVLGLMGMALTMRARSISKI